MPWPLKHKSCQWCHCDLKAVRQGQNLFQLVKGDAFFCHRFIYSPYILLKCQLAPWAVWWHLCCTGLISSDYSEVILERGTHQFWELPFQSLWHCGVASPPGDWTQLKEEDWENRKYGNMGRAHIPKHTQKATHKIQTELGPLCLSPHGDF